MVRLLKVDRWFLWSVLSLLIVGVFFFYSASASLLSKSGANYYGSIFNHLIIGCLGGLLVCYFFSKFNYLIFRKLATLGYIVSFVLTALTLTPLGVNYNGANRWLDFGLFTFQPSELLKVTTIIFVAFLLTEFHHKIKTWWGITLWLIPLILNSILLLLQPDKMTVIILGLVLFIMYIVAGGNWKFWLPLVLLGIIATFVIVWQTPYALNRITGFADCNNHLQGQCWHTTQSKIALGAGGLWGRGYNQSLQKYGPLPEAQSDSIFSIIGEELGFVGCGLVILLFISFAWSGLRLVRRTEGFGSLIILGAVLLPVFQAIINLYSMSGVIPILGEHLPFISQGGTAVFFELASAGIVMGISRYRS